MNCLSVELRKFREIGYGSVDIQGCPSTLVTPTWSGSSTSTTNTADSSERESAPDAT
ncbi:hypothetical protein HSB1_39990 [Halogranum salarium B-1]|uniref:Uncharacterized protein n=1 Tax=Halogranum salarium B-1 TaxID=1210908 RepID=J2ZX74_9EURY|nr:hypothetical protein HSB1_39990 [Halogranum salarium B-1]